MAGLAVLRPGLLPPLRWAPLTALGRASYGYYLLHQNLGIALLAALPLIGAPAVMAMLVIQIGLIWLALVLHNRVERPLLRGLRRVIDGPPQPVVKTEPQRPPTLYSS